MRRALTAFTTILFLLSPVVAQENFYYGDPLYSNKHPGFQDTIRKAEIKAQETVSLPDTNFTYEKYAAFLRKVSDTSKYVVLPINEFRTTFSNRKVVIGLRHDVDLDLNKAYDFSTTESDLGFRSTYYILHTASYYLENPSNMAVHTTRILPALKAMQNDRNLEIGWHNDLVTLQAVYNMNPSSFLQGELSWLRSNGIRINGTASHGSSHCYTYKYLNYYFFEECTWPVVGQFVNNLTLPLNGKNVPMIKGKLSDFGLDYEAYFLNNNKYFSDASITNNVRWNIGMLDLGQLVAGDRVIILLHPIHWHRASVAAEIESFHVIGQISSVIDKNNSTVTVTVPVSVNRSIVIPSFSLSDGAYVKVNGSMQTSGASEVDFTYPVTYSVYAENRDVIKNWTVRIEYQLPTSVEAGEGKESVLAYPNPSKGLFTLKFNNIKSLSTVITVVDQAGHKVFEASYDKTGDFSEVIDLSGLAAGTYYLKYGSRKEQVVVLIVN